MRNHIAVPHVDRMPAVLEITETLFVDDEERAWTFLSDLRELGIHVVIADHGTGYVSVSYPRHPGMTKYARHRNDVYQRFVLQLNARLADHHEHGMIFTDGDGSDPSYRDAHRALTAQHRRVLEDPQFPRSTENAWLQLADFVAWTAFQHLHRAPNRRVAWHWYDTYLAPCDVHGGPIAV